MERQKSWKKQVGRLLVIMIGQLICLPSLGALTPVVEVEEEVYRYTDANNGAGPFWCFGNTCVVRLGEDVFVSGLETLPDAKPLNNTRWMLFRRSASGWQLLGKDEKGRTREPCPIGVFLDGRLLLSVNPTLTGPDQYAGPAQPQILRISAKDPASAPEVILPRWAGSPAFTEHSYRSFAVDGPRQEMILFQNVGYSHAEWAFCDQTGRWTSQGQLAWPWGSEYAKPQPIRICYPAVQLRDRAVYFCGVSDIVEPNPVWRDFKRKVTGRDWDYDFRRLFFTWCPDVVAGRFAPWVEIASREQTAGYIFPCDLSVDQRGRVHLLWTERALDQRLRKDFFPDWKQSEALNYALVEGGRVVSRLAVMEWREGQKGLLPGRGRFHTMPNGRLLVLFHVHGSGPDGKPISENRLVEWDRAGQAPEPVVIPLSRPLAVFFTATVRAGCAPSDVIDILGQWNGSVRYARIRLAASP